MQQILETDRLRLREFTLEDLAAYYQLGSDPEVIRHTADPGGGFRDEDHAREILTSHPLRDYSVHGYGRLACVDRATQAVIGFAGLKYLDDLDAVDLGYRFLPAFWGRGLATEAARAVLDDGFTRLGLEEVLGLVLPGNPASARVLEKVGMHREGTLQDGDLQVLRYVIRRAT